MFHRCIGRKFLLRSYVHTGEDTRLIPELLCSLESTNTEIFRSLTGLIYLARRLHAVCSMFKET